MYKCSNTGCSFKGGELGEIEIPNKQSDKSGKIFSNITFVLGNNITTTDQKKAIQILMERDCPVIKYSEQKQTEVLFIPPVFIPNRPDLPPSDTLSACKKNMLVMNQDEALTAFNKSIFVMNQDNLNSLKGNEFEKKVYQKLQEILLSPENKAKAITVLHGWNKEYFCHDYYRSKPLEFDFILIVASEKCIVNIECKHSLKTVQAVTRVQAQLKMRQKYFEDFHGAALSGWKIKNVVFVEEFSNIGNNACLHCSKYILNEIDQLSTFLSELCYLTDNHVHFDDKYFNLVGRFVSLSKVKHRFISRIDECYGLIMESLTGSVNLSAADPSAKEFNNYPASKGIGSAQSVIFLNDLQKSLLSSDDSRILLHADYGTGKSVLLKYKAWQLAKQKRNVKFFIGQPAGASLRTMFTVKTKMEFANSTVDVVPIDPCIIENGSFFSTYNVSNVDILFDEFPVNCGQPIDQFMETLNNKVSIGKICWVALDNTSEMVDLMKINLSEHFQTPQLNLNMRNIGSVHQYSTEVNLLPHLNAEVAISPFNNVKQTEIRVGNIHNKTQLTKGLKAALEFNQFMLVVLLVHNQKDLDLVSNICRSLRGTNKILEYYAKPNSNKHSIEGQLQMFYRNACYDIIVSSINLVAGIEVANLVVIGRGQGVMHRRTFLRGVAHVTYICDGKYQNLINDRLCNMANVVDFSDNIK